MEALTHEKKPPGLKNKTSFLSAFEDRGTSSRRRSIHGHQNLSTLSSARWPEDPEQLVTPPINFSFADDLDCRT